MITKIDFQNKGKKAEKNGFLLKGFIYGCLGYITFLLLLVLFFIFLDGIKFVPYLYERLSGRFGILKFFISVVITILFFGAVGSLIAEILFLIKNKFKGFFLNSIFGRFMILLAIVLIFIDRSIINPIIGRRIILLPLLNQILSDFIILIIAFALGTFIGYVYSKLKCKKC